MDGARGAVRACGLGGAGGDGDQERWVGRGWFLGRIAQGRVWAQAYELEVEGQPRDSCVGWPVQEGSLSQGEGLTREGQGREGAGVAGVGGVCMWWGRRRR